MIKRKEFIKIVSSGLVLLSPIGGLIRAGYKEEPKGEPVADPESLWVSPEWARSIFENAVWIEKPKSSDIEINEYSFKLQHYRKSYAVHSDSMKESFLQSFVMEIAMMCMFTKSNHFKDARGIDIDGMPGAIEQVGRIPTMDDGFYLIIDKSKDMMNWSVTLGGHADDENSYHILSSCYLTNNQDIKKGLKSYDGKALKYLPKDFV